MAEMTVEAWIQLQDGTANQMFVTRGYANQDFSFYLMDQRIRMLAVDQEGYTHANAAPPAVGQWFHCAGTLDTQGVKRLYYNGELQAQSQGDYKAIQSQNDITIGAMLGSLLFPERPFHGKMENIRIWNKALSQEDIQKGMQTPPEKDNLTTMKVEGLVAYWSSRAVEGDTIQDQTGNGHDGTRFTEASQTRIVKTTPAEGYHGIWYSNQPSDDKYRYKYSGGLGTYCGKHRHLAHYVAEVNKTFFVYGGTKGLDDPNPLLIMISYYDHNTNKLARPVMIQEKGTADAHHNPVLSIDAQGHLWVFASAHGGKDGFLWKSTQPYAIEEFELVMQKEFTYPQPNYIPEKGFVFLFTKYTGGRELYVNHSADGYTWGEDTKIAGFGGHYQVTEQIGHRQGTAFNWHPPQGGLNARTNLYYMQTNDLGQSWTTVDGKALAIPLDNPKNPALVHDYQAEGLLVYMKDLIYDENQNPIILTVVSKGYESGPENGPRYFHIAHWQGAGWKCRNIVETDHNYDTGSIWIDEGVWNLLVPSSPGPQAYCTGGDVVLWQSQDQGETWTAVREMTANSPRNHTYVRRVVNAHPDFQAFWADGDALQPSPSRLYFCNRSGDRVWVMPNSINGAFADPEPYPQASNTQ
jgi:hypothetical protein